ncbi:MAG TPA: hypothetical protein VKW08_19260 [Xanthobacteraceae bacterium]|jgi:hypothetical protein|nr:hypothetical protein [Xanthobacteraceae bacterium]
MSKPVPDKAEIVLEYPGRFFIETFDQSAQFVAHADEAGISLSLDSGGEADERKSVRLQVHAALFAEILAELAGTASALPAGSRRDALRNAAGALYEALAADPDDVAGLTPEDEVLLLHAIE